MTVSPTAVARPIRGRLARGLTTAGRRPCPGRRSRRSGPRPRPHGPGAVDQTVILLHPLLPVVGVTIGMERGCQQSDSFRQGLHGPAQRCARPPPAAARASAARTRSRPPLRGVTSTPRVTSKTAGARPTLRSQAPGAAVGGCTAETPWERPWERQCPRQRQKEVAGVSALRSHRTRRGRGPPAGPTRSRRRRLARPAGRRRRWGWQPPPSRGRPEAARAAGPRSATGAASPAARKVRGGRGKRYDSGGESTAAAASSACPGARRTDRPLRRRWRRRRRRSTPAVAVSRAAPRPTAARGALLQRANVSAIF